MTRPESPVPLGEPWWFRMQRAGGGEVRDLRLRKTSVQADPVPQAAEPRIIPAGPHRVGYLELREFAPPAAAGLRRAMAQFRQQGVTDLIVDLRYNPGGDLDTLVLLANLLCAPGADGGLMFRFHDHGHTAFQPIWFRLQPETVQPLKLAFIVTRESGSASEAVVHALAPYYRRNLALVGQRTHGKPVGCSVFTVPGSDLELSLVVHQVENADGCGGYFDGLPYAQFPGDTCAAEDDLDHAPGDPAEASTAAALRWILHGSSERGPIPPARS
jgi:C-terminal processing protease CtpA/Prc